MEGMTRGIYEVFTTALVVILLLITISGVTLVTDTKFTKAKLIAQETSYVSSLISNDNTKINLNYKDLEDINVKTNNNQINVIINNDNNKIIEQKYIGQNIEIKQNQNKITITS